MARPSSRYSRPGRALLALLVMCIALGGLMLGKQSYVPGLALDLAGGTTVTLLPHTEKGDPSDEQLQKAVEIIRKRVNGLGIAEAEVTTEGSNIKVAVPGVGQKKVRETVGETAKMDFRQVIAIDSGRPAPAPTGSQSPAPTGAETPVPTEPAKGDAATPEASASASPTARGRAVPEGLVKPSESPSPKGSEKPSDKPTDDPKATPGTDGQLPGIPKADPKVQAEFQKLDCSKYKPGSRGIDDPGSQITACSEDGQVKYLLDKAAVEGTRLTGAQAVINQQTNKWQVNLSFDSTGAKEWAAITNSVFQMPEPYNQVAVVMDGLVSSAPRIMGPIPGGQAEITGEFTQQEAEGLAQVLDYGALPITLESGDATSVSSTLGSDQLRGGIIAGLIGIILIVLYSLLYYRGLGLVAIASLLVCALVTWQLVTVIGAYAGFRLSLAHIIGLIVSIGIAADSFIIFFEKIRDELREGRRALRVAVEVAWRRAKRTILVADAVTFIAALALYFLSVGGVAGFAFAMGLTTLIDVLVVFMFTKPLVALLARMKFFAQGHRLSGLDRNRLRRGNAGKRPAPRSTPTPQET